jgi:hypothetical protein
MARLHGLPSFARRLVALVNLLLSFEATGTSTLAGNDPLDPKSFHFE